MLSHAIADALLGANGELDSGHHFPNSDETIRGISSLEILKGVAKILVDKNAAIVNVDSTLIAEAPKIGPHLAAIRANLAGALGIPAERVGVKATTNELLGAIGRGEGMAAMAVASVDVK